MTRLEMYRASFKTAWGVEKTKRAIERLTCAWRKAGVQIGWLGFIPMRWDFPTWVPRAHPYDQEFDDT